MTRRYDRLAKFSAWATLLAGAFLGTTSDRPVEAAVTVSPSASHMHSSDGGHGTSPLAALCDEREVAASNDHKIPRFTFWSHKGTTEWIQYKFDRPMEVSSVAVYWYDDRPGGGCRVPGSWVLLYDTGYDWKPVPGAKNYGTAADQFNEVTFQPVSAAGLRIEVRQQQGMSSGILEWKINGQTPKLGKLGRIGPDEDAGPTVDYLATQLALDTLAKAVGADDPAVEQAATQMNDVVDAMTAARAKIGLGDREAAARLNEAVDQFTAIGKQFSPANVIARLSEADPDACLRLAIQLDWIAQDTAGGAGSALALASGVIDGLDPSDASLTASRDKLLEANVSAADPRWMELYLAACDRRRTQRLGPHLDRLRRVVFTKHHDIGGQHYAYTEDVSDSPYRDNNPFPHSGKLCLLEMDGAYGKVRTLVDEPDGLVRDPDVSYDGRRVLFARRTSMTEDDYHLYEMDAQTEEIRQITFGEAVADYEPAYLPGGDIIFNSSRCQQIVDCWWADVSNLYTCDGDGKYLRRISFDQVHTNYPQVLPDGRVTYTRWDYNDRGQLFPQPLFQMNADGTGQTEFYGNNSWFPTTILHARGIPGSQKILCVLSGHHTYQKGKLALIDTTKGRQENSGVQLIAPVRQTDAVRIDKYGYQGEQFQYPFPLNETEYLVTYSPEGSAQGRSASKTKFGIYYMDIDGRRELLAADPKISCNQSIPLASRQEPPARPSRVDYRFNTGRFFLQDVYYGPGLEGIPRGTIKKLRVVALDFRAAGVGSNGNRGPAGGALVSTPISINGAWDVKRVLGTARVHDDGSAAFIVPARTPLYFQALDDNGHVVQTMRSWSTLQPGETFSCMGCHEDKNSSPPRVLAPTEAMKLGAQKLDDLNTDPRGFSFVRQVQPILDRHCVECHNRKEVAEGRGKISLEGATTFDGRARKNWSDAYSALANPKVASWVSPQSAPPMLAPYEAGAAKSPLIELLQKGHEKVILSRAEMDTIACWIDLAVPFSGEYTEGMNEDDAAKYQVWLDKRNHWAEVDAKNIQALIDANR